jgi:hypothetical protein
MSAMACCRQRYTSRPSLTSTRVAIATFALKAGVWFYRVRFVICSPDPRQSSPFSGKKSTYRPVQIHRSRHVCTLQSELDPV